MKKSKIVESNENTFYIKRRGMPKGCQQCLKGVKTVLFLNGICQEPAHCSWYCPISEERKGKGNTFANEIQISSNEELLKEIEKTNAKGMSITGGEPLSTANLKRTIEFIKFIKKNKGRKFHIHLYTNGINFNESIAKMLALAGLDEIRFHPPLNKWDNIKHIINKGIRVGAEVPVIPSKKYINDLEKFVKYLDDIGADFINLNEFEYCFPNSKNLRDKGYKLKEGTIASVENSLEEAFNFIKKLENRVSLKIHLCTIRAKDYFQLRNRYLRRAKSIKLPYEVITEEGLLLHGQIEGTQENLRDLYGFLISELKVPKKLISFEEGAIKLPFYIAVQNEIIRFLDEKNLDGYILEVLPFKQEQYREITEITPIKVFKEEEGLDVNK